MYLCMYYVCMYVCICIRVYGFLCMYVCTYVCMCVCERERERVQNNHFFLSVCRPTHVTNPLTRTEVVCVCNGPTFATGCAEAVYSKVTALDRALVGRFTCGDLGSLPLNFLSFRSDMKFS
jgi:hypothetical protein